VDLYADNYESPKTYVRTIEEAAASAGSWAPVAIKWEDLERASWEEDAGQPFVSPDRIVGLAFGIGAPEDSPVATTVWIDDLRLLSGEPPPSAPQEMLAAPTEEGEAEGTSSPLPCKGGLALPLLLVGVASLRSRRRSR
jgi:hypothetical protein